jgi:predicted esterase
MTASGVNLPAQDVPRDTIVEKVDCAEFSGQSYALYLPPGYTAAQAWPILYIFDARGRGAMAARNFEDAARRYGYILASSNNSRSDGPVDPNITAIRAMWTDTHSRFSLDPQRAYATGFSGGARVACLMASTAPGTIAGVIGCAGGFHRPPQTTPPFSFFGAVGDKDFNYLELRGLDRTLEKLRAPHRIVVFDGGHSWPPDALCREAVEWMEIRAVREGRVPRDWSEISRLFDSAVERGTALERQGLSEEAFERYEGLAEDFRGLCETSAFEAWCERYGRSSEHARRSRKRAAQEVREAKFLEGLTSVWAEIRSPEEVLPVGRLTEELHIRDLKRQAEQRPPSEETLCAERLLNAEFVQTGFYLPEEFLGRKNFARAILCLSVAAEIRPERPSVWHDLAAAHALAGDTGEAIVNLRKAISAGFADVAALEEDPDFKALREDLRFKEIVEALKGKS